MQIQKKKIIMINKLSLIIFINKKTNKKKNKYILIYIIINKVCSYTCLTCKSYSACLNCPTNCNRIYISLNQTCICDSGYYDDGHNSTCQSLKNIYLNIK